MIQVSNLHLKFKDNQKNQLFFQVIDSLCFLY